ncbi:MAG: Rieske 2Fe-2S domain-containing protein [Myxococcales bacterium]|nr:Rieske 2Fe-2S domain-containing protein [Myxococcales bacterium]
MGRRPVPIRRFGSDLVLWRGSDGAIRCAFDACPHRGAALSRGRIVDGALSCRYHGLSFADDGRCRHIPAHPSRDRSDLCLRMFPVREARGLVWVFNGHDSSLPELPWTDEIDAHLQSDGAPTLDITDRFDVSYLRVMENLTDYHHVPFVHRGLVPIKPEVTRFEAWREGQHVHTEGAMGGLEAETDIYGPCFAVLSFAGTARFAVCATPIDEGNTWLFARYSQCLVRFPGLTLLATWLLGQFDYRLLQKLQDAPVWRSQRLADPADIRRYTLLPADQGVRLYFEMHAELAS